ncbi:hypothetical protein K437DRAFT_255616 [Tilletiaria anomala UBC 951]|uniref:GTP cyclohydrolase II n=1 Tax=Tilletiaria anomala (strain ATCC 24038 / CBS 436.72 / UBC 951) TaxID=1037660 RepID=A0A066W6L6_TILAU|nr:uncharacterized protein K437DRAFT_255616 [Tilletiaria anomala UBC 951]KDN48193.1 hypothetical protein K437DRAFT_255616 [Tilletiaria anomala UBC 951]
MSDSELLSRILQEVVDLKSKNAQLESKIDSLAAAAAAGGGSIPVGSPSSHARRGSHSSGLTPILHGVTGTSGTVGGAQHPVEPSSALLKSPPPQPLGPSALTSSSSAPSKELPAATTNSSAATASAFGVESGEVAGKSAKRNADIEAYFANTRVILTSYPNQVGIDPYPLSFGHPDPQVRGPVLASRHPGSIKLRNAIGTYGGSYMVYRALASAIGDLSPDFRPDFTNTEPPFDIPQQPEWGDPYKICTLDPFGHIPQVLFKKQIDEGLDVRPTIAATKAHIKMPELDDALKLGRLSIDGKIVIASTHLPGMDPRQDPGCEVNTSKISVEPVWYLPGVAHRLGISEGTLRRALFEETGGMYPELLTRHDLSVFLPPITGATVYIFGDPAYLSDPTKELTARVHDECNGSDVFGSDICTCRPYLLMGIEEAVKCAQRGGVGLIVYFRKEGRALGETIKYQVYNARKRGNDTASEYFNRTSRIAGVKDSRMQPLMSDILVWLCGTKRKLDRLISMSDMKYDAITAAGIQVGTRYEIPEDRLPADSRVEIDAKIQAGYYSTRAVTEEDLKKVVGRGWENVHQ